MSDAQRLAHNRERYWNGPLTRAEAQKVFDETAGVIQKAQETIVKLDLVLAFLVDKSGVPTTEIQTWIDHRVKTMQAAMQAEQAQQAQQAAVQVGQPVQERATEPALVTLD